MLCGIIGYSGKTQLDSSGRSTSCPCCADVCPGMERGIDGHVRCRHRELELSIAFGGDLILHRCHRRGDDRCTGTTLCLVTRGHDGDITSLNVITIGGYHGHHHIGISFCG